MTGSDTTMNDLGPKQSLNTAPYFLKYEYRPRKAVPSVMVDTSPSASGAPSTLGSSPMHIHTQM